jgi:predicted GIY-YIG superfamily endonuclease
MFNKKKKIMGYIYCITNLINNKRYVGKTTQNPQARFREHCQDS